MPETQIDSPEDQSVPRTFVCGQRVHLRSLSMPDCDAFQAYRDRDDVARFQSWVEWTRREAEGFIRAMQDKPFIVLGEWVQIGIALNENNRLIGDLGLWQHRHQPEVVQIGYTIDPKFQQRGFAKEAVGLAIAHLFEQHSIERILATVDARNTPSWRLLEALDFVKIKIDHTSFKLEPIEEWTYALRSPHARITLHRE